MGLAFGCISAGLLRITDSAGPNLLSVHYSYLLRILRLRVSLQEDRRCLRGRGLPAASAPLIWKGASDRKRKRRQSTGMGAPHIRLSEPVPPSPQEVLTSPPCLPGQAPSFLKESTCFSNVTLLEGLTHFRSTRKTGLMSQRSRTGYSRRTSSWGL